MFDPDRPVATVLDTLDTLRRAADRRRTIVQ
jgi:hypothetical protein